MKNLLTEQNAKIMNLSVKNNEEIKRLAEEVERLCNNKHNIPISRKEVLDLTSKLGEIEEYLRMSLRELQEDFNKLLKNQQYNDNIEAAATKIVKEIKIIIQDCPCNKEILDALQTGTSSKEIIIPDEKFRKPLKYSYPNFSVGNEEMGIGKNSGSLS